jgi:diguanylate cyclase (GGDEF)-like protein
MTANIGLDEFHWLLDIVQNIDVGVVVLDRDYRIEVWNSFMENHSGLKPESAYQQQFFEVFPEVDEQWFRRKAETVALLGIRTFTIWEQRPYLVRFKSYQPITGLEDCMYQNTTMLPLKDAHGNVAHICVIIYDVTKVAVNSKQLQGANAQLEQLSRTDRLTGLFNRGYWEECLSQEFARHRRSQSTSSLVIFDIDHFKRVNDTYGHPAGDAVIRRVAELTRQHMRSTDIAGRYGGEEFVVLLPDTDLQGAVTFAERLRLAVQETSVVHAEQPLSFTISLGIALLSANSCESHGQLVERADQALYQSKEGGRNRVSVFQSS